MNAPQETKVCSRCLVEKPLENFVKSSRSRNGRGSTCRPCHNAYCSAQFKADPERQTTAVKRWRAANVDRRREIDREYGQRECRKEWRRRYDAANADRIRENRRQWRERNKDWANQWCSEWARQNRGKITAKSARRKAVKMRATPAWANPREIREIYEASALLGPAFHVDHIVPLRSPLVCGLHVEANLRIIPAPLNLAKHNKRWPDMFEVGQ